MAKVREVMSKNVPHVEVTASILEASKIMNRKRGSGVVVFQAGKPVGVLTERSLLRRFVNLNKKPGEVRVEDVMAPLLKINADASIKEATKKILENSLTRLGVFDDGEFVGWVTLTDIARAESKKSIVDVLLRHNQPDAGEEMICPDCRQALMLRIVSRSGEVLRWECPKCHHEE